MRESKKPVAMVLVYVAVSSPKSRGQLYPRLDFPITSAGFFKGLPLTPSLMSTVSTFSKSTTYIHERRRKNCEDIIIGDRLGHGNETRCSGTTDL